METRVTRSFSAGFGVSKSMAKAMGCQHYFAFQYARRLTMRMAPHPLANSGTQFHKFLADYVTHLVATSREMDLDWVNAYIENTDLSEDATWLIRHDSQTFRINADTLYGAEVFLSCDRNMNPLDHEIGNATPGKLSSNPESFASATLDLLVLDGPRAVVIDAKSGYSTVGVTDDEPFVNAIVVFAHFPQVKQVKFIWSFIRSQTNRHATFYRDKDLPWIRDRVEALNKTKTAIIAAASRGEALEVNPGAGLCPHCALQCPLRAHAKDLAFMPPQTDLDRKRMAGIIHVCEQYLAQARPMLRAAMDTAGPVRLSADWIYTPVTTESNSYPLVDALNALDLAVVDLSCIDEQHKRTMLAGQPTHAATWDIPLDALTAGATKLNAFAKTKASKKRKDPETGESIGGVSREGLAERLQAVAKTYPKTTMRFKRESSTDLLDALQQSIEAGDSGDAKED